jgi:hypothetical protein
MEVEHLYLSTACLHERHDQCGTAQHDRGEPGHPHCKFCDAECVCPCHWEETQ